ncbi:MAG TPA: acylphosphatase [Candidatus Hydrogenedentes bacterium]|nr:acylphosphatase [Candidatus Hydrogenedentota bacterium]HOT50159.1 acylphosphatase [Candidatus Hydrogenedentota bacterium]HPC16874.1 acylphosphatase [Candidatus Hydrogenedentota bacterium]HRT20699.1 acylphosphatase [Candidatus Hydrogenedentota bacterium]HRT66181.1 acylphosphatase [Candidatus Hydrogenedentota bacterium]
MTDRLHVFVTGRVQGVGFRYSTEDRARSLGLYGWVRNLPDGRVEAEFEGPKPALEEMLEWCRQGPRFAAVARVEADWEQGEPRYREFACR